MIASFIFETPFDLPAKESRVDEINELMSGPTFWDNQEKAQAIVGELSALKAALKPVEELSSAADDLGVLLEFAAEDESSIPELERTAASIERDLAAAELQAMLSGSMDHYGAYVKIQAGEGGTDASDWAEMVLRMYLRWAEQHGYKCSVVERSDAEEAGIRSATIQIDAPYVYGWLKGENGVHRLIRISPFDSAGRRQTSFAAVDVTPILDDTIEIDIDWAKDVNEETMRAGGAGGQHVNKTESAIRLTHIETNTVVYCQNERSQHQNRANARKMLTAKLYQMEVEKQEAEVAARRGEKSKIGFGGETARNYVLHPDQFVKDTRTNYKVGNPQPVLDGDLDPFLEEHLRWAMGKE